jgi:hypothetical protein
MSRLSHYFVGALLIVFWAMTGCASESDAENCTGKYGCECDTALQCNPGLYCNGEICVSSTDRDTGAVDADADSDADTDTDSDVDARPRGRCRGGPIDRLAD